MISRKFLSRLCLAGFLVLLAMGKFPNSAIGQVDQAIPRAVADLIDQSCLDCHDSGSKEGDLDLESLRLDLKNPDNFHIWERVFVRVREGEMPPDSSLESCASQDFRSWANISSDHLHCFEPIPSISQGVIHASDFVPEFCFSFFATVVVKHLAHLCRR